MIPTSTVPHTLVRFTFFFFLDATLKMKVLYVANDNNDKSEYCPGSIVCMALVEKIKTHKITVQNCTVLRKTNTLPDWLNGTPIFIDNEEGTPYRGTDAVNILKHKLRQEQQSDQQVRHAPKNNGSTNSRGPMRPDMQRMGGDIDKKAAPKYPEEAPESDEDYDDSGANFELDTTEDGDPSQSNAEIRSEKVTEQDLQKYMEQRNQSKASIGQAQGDIK